MDIFPLKKKKKAKKNDNRKKALSLENAGSRQKISPFYRPCRAVIGSYQYSRSVLGNKFAGEKTERRIPSFGKKINKFTPTGELIWCFSFSSLMVKSKQPSSESLCVFRYNSLHVFHIKINKSHWKSLSFIFFKRTWSFSVFYILREWIELRNI